MVKTQKTRRHSGRVTPLSTIRHKKPEIIEECLEPQEMYNDWENFRDGFRGYDDRTKLRDKNMRLGEYFEVERWNKKIKKQNKVREARKQIIKQKIKTL